MIGAETASLGLGKIGAELRRKNERTSKSKRFDKRSPSNLDAFIAELGLALKELDSKICSAESIHVLTSLQICKMKELNSS